MSLLHFAARELKPYAQPISEKDLKEGSIYFMVTFVDDEMLIPTIDTVVFIGRNLDQHDFGKVYFQDVSSYRQGVRYDSEYDAQADVSPVRFFSGPEAETNHIFEFENALEVLMKCSLSRNARSEASGF